MLILQEKQQNSNNNPNKSSIFAPRKHQEQSLYASGLANRVKGNHGGQGTMRKQHY